MRDKLSTYRHKRDFQLTPEPRGKSRVAGKRLRFVVQKHAARRLHYDFRLELGGALKSWAVPKGPSLDPGDKRLAVHVEDHPLDYAEFEGVIPPKQYGAGTVIVWDRGEWLPEDDPIAAYQAGKMKFQLKGEKLSGGWMLVRTRLKASGDKEQWLLIKERDSAARAATHYDVTEALPHSVLPRHATPDANTSSPQRRLKVAKRSVEAPTPDSLGNAKKSTLPKHLEISREQTRVIGPAKKSPVARRTAGEVVASIIITHPERLIDQRSGVTKIELARYYEAISPWLLPHLKARPVALLRAPEGIGGEQFFQKHMERLTIPKMRMLDEQLDAGHAPLMVIDSIEALVGAAQMGMIELHTWNAISTSIERPDRIVFDLDPDLTLNWSHMIEAANLTKTLLDELGLQSFLKTSGGKGLHLVVPLARRHTWDTVKRFSQAVAQHLANTIPARFSAKMGAQNRIKKVFVDYLRNRRGASTVSAYSARARASVAVSTPVAWDELPELTGSDQWTIRTLNHRLTKLNHDPWAQYAHTRQSLSPAAKRLGVALADD